MKALQYIKTRAKEKSTWGGISLAIAGANAFTPPWDVVGVAVGVIMVFLDTTDEKTTEE